LRILVQKFGGTSVATPAQRARAATKVLEAKARGYSPVVVVSAMGRMGEPYATDTLIDLVRKAHNEVDRRELDLVLSCGEVISTVVMAQTLRAMGCPAVGLTGAQAGIITDDNFGNTSILEVRPDRVVEQLRDGKVVVVAGFQGVTRSGDVTTLGRGGSDTTAVALAAALKADACEIHSDVDGVYTADPAICPQARHLRRITYGEMLEMADMGAKILQIRSVELARKFKVPLLIKSSFGSDKCTWIVEEEINMESAVISGIILSRNEAKLSVIRVPDRPGVAYRILAPLAEAAINVDMIIQNASIDGCTDFTFTVPKTDLKKTRELVEQVITEIGAQELRTDDDIAKVSAVGLGIKNCPGVAARMFKALAGEGINIQMISTSDIRISCVIEAKYGELAVRVLHDAFELEKRNNERTNNFSQ